MNTVRARFNTTMGQVTKLSQVEKNLLMLIKYME